MTCLRIRYTRSLMKLKLLISFVLKLAHCALKYALHRQISQKASWCVDKTSMNMTKIFNIFRYIQVIWRSVLFYMKLHNKKLQSTFMFDIENEVLICAMEIAFPLKVFLDACIWLSVHFIEWMKNNIYLNLLAPSVSAARGRLNSWNCTQRRFVT